MNILFIPHVPNLKVVNRVYEFAKQSDSYFLYWEIDNSSLGHKIASQLKSFRYKQEGKMVQIPLLFKPEKLSVKYNTFMLNRLIDKLNIDLVVNANALLFDVASIKVPVVYDLVDDHLEINLDIGLNEERVEKIKHDIKYAKAVVTVTKQLEKKVRNLKLNTYVQTIENGVYIDRFKNARSLKEELGLKGKKVFGFIGGIEPWTGIDKAIEQYLKIKNEKTAFLVVGGNDGAFYKNLVRTYGDEVLFVGAVAPSDVAGYFKSIDAGLIPFELNDFTHNALPIKALEYALGGACVISTPLRGLKAKRFPFISFCKIDDFAAIMQSKCNKTMWDFSMYEWHALSQKLVNMAKRFQ